MAERQAFTQSAEAQATAGSDALKVPMSERSNSDFIARGQAARAEATQGLVGSGTLPGLELVGSGQTVRTEGGGGNGPIGDGPGGGGNKPPLAERAGSEATEAPGGTSGSGNEQQDVRDSGTAGGDTPDLQADQNGESGSQGTQDGPAAPNGSEGVQETQDAPPAPTGSEAVQENQNGPAATSGNEASQGATTNTRTAPLGGDNLQKTRGLPPAPSGEQTSQATEAPEAPRPEIGVVPQPAPLPVPKPTED